MASSRVIIEINEAGKVQSSFLEEKSLKARGNFRPFHGPSFNNPEETFKAALDDIPIGTVIGGDFNVNFLVAKNLEAFRAYLRSRKLRLKVSPQFIEKLTVYFKMRVRSLWNPQLLKMDPDIFLKDLMFELAPEEEGEPTIPFALEEKLKDLTNVRNDWMQEIDKLPQDQITPEKIMEVCPEKHKQKVVSYHNIKQSAGDDHPSSFYIDHARRRIYYAKNSHRYLKINFEGHFKEGLELKIEDAEKLYDDYAAVIFKETYKLLKLRDEGIAYDEHKPEEFSNLDELISYAKKSIKDNPTICEDKTKLKTPNSRKLNKEDFRNFFTNILKSPEFTAINAILRQPFEDIDEIIEYDLIATNNLPLLDNRLDKALHAMLQGLNYRKLPKEGEHCVSVTTIGFKPLLDDDGKMIPADVVTDRQIANEKKELEELTRQFPAYSLHVAQLVENNDQDRKVNEITISVLESNQEARQYRDQGYYLALMPTPEAEQKDATDAMPATFALEKNAIEIKCDIDKLNYRVLGLDGTEQKGFILWEDLQENFPRKNNEILDDHKSLLPIILEITTKAGHTEQKEFTANLSLQVESAAERYNQPNTPVSKMFAPKPVDETASVSSKEIKADKKKNGSDLSQICRAF